MVELAVLGISSFLDLLLGLVVYLKNPNSATNRLFFMLASSFSAWSIASYISIHPFLFSQVVWVRLVLFCAALLCLSVFLTFTVFPSARMVGSRRIRKLAVAYTIFVMCLTLTPFVFTVGSGAKPVPNFGIGLFALLAAGLLGGGLFNLVKKYNKSAGKEKSQLRVVIVGLVATFGLILLTNFVFVVLFNFTKLIFLGPAYTLIFSSALAYSIIKHHLFDIRSAVARAAAYLLALGFIGALYGGFIYIVTALLGKGSISDNGYRIVFIAFALLSSLLYGPLKRFFDKLTNRIFYRDAYDPQTFLNQLNETLVSNIELGILLRHATRVIAHNLKAEFCLVGVRETETRPWRVMGTGDYSLNAADSHFIREELSRIGKKIVATDEIGSSHNRLKRLLEQGNIAIIANLITSYGIQQEATAYLILGPKKSGNIYNKQDLRILDIVANELLIAVQNALRFEEIEGFNVTLQSRVNEATAKLQKTNEKLKELDETKDEFISMASHQLRTPLTSVKGYLSMVLEGDAGKLNDMQRDLLGQSFASSQRMVYLIADLLNVSRLKTGKFIIDAKPTDLPSVVEGEIDQLKEAAKAKKIKLAYHKPTDFPQLMLDETKTRQVIMNFADNAIYYTPEGGTISIELKQDRSNIYFMVKDNGLGVPKDEQPRLFGKFYRATNAQKARPDGTGLGLFMAKKVINAQGGTIIFESKEGKGSTFGFAFEKSKLMATADS